MIHTSRVFASCGGWESREGSSPRFMKFEEVSINIKEGVLIWSPLSGVFFVVPALYQRSLPGRLGEGLY